MEGRGDAGGRREGGEERRREGGEESCAERDGAARATGLSFGTSSEEGLLLTPAANV